MCGPIEALPVSRGNLLIYASIRATWASRGYKMKAASLRQNKRL